MDNRPIGVFDSGIGGITVLDELIKQLPGEDIIYFGDTARIPYGTRSKEAVVRYFLQSTRFLKTKDIKAIVIACNTATALAMKEAEEEFDLPFIGVVEPGSEAAVKVSQNGSIGIIGTTGTINSEAYQKNIRRKNKDLEVVGKACPLYVQIVEEGWENSDVAYITTQKYLQELKERKIDTLVLGCTHYPALRYTIAKYMGEGVELVNPAYETAKRVKALLKEEDRLSDKLDGGQIEYFVSDDPEKFKRVGGNLLNKDIKNVSKIDIEKY